MFKLLSLKNGEKDDIYVSSANVEKNNNTEYSDENYYTLITGENGCGKSSLLSKAANAYIFQSNNNFIHGRETFDSQHAPSRVIAICNSSYNRFVSKKVYTNLTPIREPHYYLQNDVESDSTRSLQSIIIPAIKEVLANYQFENITSDNFNIKKTERFTFRNRSQIEDITSAFHMIGIEPSLSMELEYNKGYIQFFLKTQGTGIHHDIKSGNDIKLGTMEKVYYKEHIDFLRSVHIEDGFIDYFLHIFLGARSIKQPTKLNLRVDSHDFEFSSAEMPLDIILPAILCGFIIPKKIQVQRMGSLKWVSIQSLSSGQQSLLISALLISTFAIPNSLICIDEPENSLHPEWQLDYMNFIAKLCPYNLGCHFLIATHSPQIISGMKSTNGCIVSLNSGHKKNNSFESLQPIEYENFISNNQELHELSSHIRKSADRQLIDIFKSPGFHNETIIHRLVLILTKLTKKIALNSDDSRFINEISSFIKHGKIDEYDAANIILEQIKAMLKPR